MTTKISELLCQQVALFATLAALAGRFPANACSVADHGWISVKEHDGRWVMVDKFDREMLFRGVNVNLQAWRPAEDDRPMDPSMYTGGKCPPNRPDVYKNPPLCGVQAWMGKYNQSTAPDSGNDLAQIRAFGFDVIRLGISWSLLEPIPGNYSAQYLDRIGQVVDWAREQDVRVILDMHQDFYSFSLDDGHKIGSYVDGAPAWAVLNSSIDRFPFLKREIFNKVGFDWETVAAFQTFFNNEVPVGSKLGWGLQEHYIRCWAQVVARFRDDPIVLGFELMNEPAPSEVDLLLFSDRLLYPFYRRTIQALTGVRDGMPDCPFGSPVSRGCAFPDLGVRDTRHIIFFEPMAIRNQLDVSIQISEPFTEYSNIVYAPHTYSYSFTVKLEGFLPVAGYHESLDTAWSEATRMRAGVLVTEFGAADDHPERLEGIVKWQDLRFTSSTFWVWKESGGGWGLWNGNMDEPGHNVRADRLRVLSHTRPLAVSGRLHRLAFDTKCNTMTMSAVGVPGPQSPTLIYIPSGVNTSQPIVTGAAGLAKSTVAPDGSTIVEVLPSNTTVGEYSVLIKGGPSCQETFEADLGVPMREFGSHSRDSSVRSASWVLV